MLLELAFGIGAPSSPTGDTRSRSRSRGVLLMGLVGVGQRPLTEGRQRIAGARRRSGPRSGPWV